MGTGGRWLKGDRSCLSEVQGHLAEWKGNSFFPITSALTAPRWRRELKHSFLPVLGKGLSSPFTLKCKWLVPLKVLTTLVVLLVGKGCGSFIVVSALLKDVQWTNTTFLALIFPLLRLSFFPPLPFVILLSSPAVLHPQRVIAGRDLHICLWAFNTCWMQSYRVLISILLISILLCICNDQNGKGKCSFKEKTKDTQMRWNTVRIISSHFCCCLKENNPFPETFSGKKKKPIHQH